MWIRKQFLPSAALSAGMILLLGTCSTVKAQNGAAWTWVGGGNRTANDNGGQSGNYGQRGTASATNMPPGRWGSATWTDANGNLWLLGGSGYYAATNETGVLMNDLWVFAPSVGMWTWMSGSNSPGAQSPGTYGTLGMASTNNVPGCRSGSVSWGDSNGNLWLFGGNGCDANGNVGLLNDLWKYASSAEEWTWMGGSSTLVSNSGRPGIYGTAKVPAAGNIPGARSGATGWVDAEGDLWLFGGQGVDSQGNTGLLNDLWRYKPETNEWTWMGGNSTVPQGGGVAGTYGSLGSSSAGAQPGSRFGSALWIDTVGNAWFFGGSGYDANDQLTTLNDLWTFSPANTSWMWLAGSTTTTGCVTYKLGLVVCGGQPGIYGTFGTPATTNAPGARASAAAWTDHNGNFWMFGGQGYDSAGNSGNLNDLWEFNPSTRSWTWMGGNTTEARCQILPEGNSFCKGQPGIYGTLGTPGPGNDPGARFGAAEWVDKQGALWLFGGYGVDETGTAGVLNDLWEYQQSIPILPPAATPTFSPAAGTYTSTQTIMIFDATPGTTIYFTTDGTAPTTASNVYTSPVTISASGALTSETIEAIAVASGYSASAMGSATYAIKLPPDFSIAILPASLSISAGQSQTATIRVTPSNGFDGVVSFACSGLPRGTSCSFDPATVMPRLSALSTTLTVTNSATTATLHHASRGWFPTLATIVVCVGWKKKKKLFLDLVALALCVIGLGFLSGCGGSASKSQSTTVTVTATSGSLTHSATLTLSLP